MASAEKNADESGVTEPNYKAYKAYIQMLYNLKPKQGSKRGSKHVVKLT